MNKKRNLLKKLTMFLMGVMCAVLVFGVNTKTTEAASKKSITLNETSKTLRKGETTTITVKKVKGLKSKKVTFKSSNKKVATVSSKGVVTAKKKGSATITVTSKENKKVKAKFKVKVTEQNIEKFLKDNKAKIRKIGSTFTQKGLFHEHGDNLFMYDTEVSTKYTAIQNCPWDSKYDIITVAVTTKVPCKDNYWYIGWRNNLYDMNGKSTPVKHSYFDRKGKTQMYLTHYYADYTIENNYREHYIYYNILVKKDEGAYLMHGGYDSMEDYNTKGAVNTDSPGGKYIEKSDIRKNNAFFYISSKDAKKALNKK